MSSTKRIGTVNFHRSQNYGALMVAYSLKTYLKRLGIDSITVDYFPDYHKAMYPQPHKEFQEFINGYLGPFGSPEDEYDLLIYGADTIWEYYKNYGYDDAYWGSEKLRAKRRITYSASASMHNFSPESDRLFQKYLPAFAAVSVREDALQTYLRQLTGVPVLHTCDPTLLLTPQDYEAIMAERIIAGDYAVIYNRQLSRKLPEIAGTVRRKTGMPVYILNGDGKLLDETGAVIRCDMGPREFLSMVRYSSFVLAASFHATAFSIIFRKPFYSIMKSGGERVESLLRSAGLENRLIDHSSQIVLEQGINFARVYDRLSRWIAKSKKYLEENLEQKCEGD